MSGSQTQSDPAGGHPGRVVGGHLGGQETWEVWSLEGQKLDDLYRRRVFPGDVANCFICFIRGNLCPIDIAPSSVPKFMQEIEIYRVYAARLSTPAPLSNSPNCLR